MARMMIRSRCSSLPLVPMVTFGHQRMGAGTGNLLQKRAAAAMPDFARQILHTGNRMIKDRRIDSRIPRAMGVGAGDGGKVVLMPVLKPPAVAEHGMIAVEYLDAVKKRIQQFSGSGYAVIAVGVGPHQGGQGIEPADVSQ